MEHTKLSKAGLIALFSLGLILAACTGDETSSISLPSSTTSDSTSSSTTSSTTEQYDIITVAEAIKIAETAPEDGTEKKYYIRGEVSNLTNTQFGNFDLVDSTGSIYVYGLYNEDGSVRYDKMENAPVEGDTITVYSSIANYKGNKPELMNAWLVEHTPAEKPDYDYKEMSIKEARSQKQDTPVQISGTVAAISYANGMKPRGFMLVDDESSMYVFTNEASKVKVGNNVTVQGLKDYWILDTEQGYADKFGYQGANQITDVTILENDNGDHEINKDWITTISIKDLMETPSSQDITGLIYRVNCLVSKKVGSGFDNYYFYDMDGHTGSYAYTSNNGSDFSWLDQYDGKLCTVLLTALNMKGSDSGVFYRFLPIEVESDSYVYPASEFASYVETYVVKPQFEEVYYADPAKLLETKVSNDLINLKDATVEYSVTSGNEYFYLTTTGEGTTLHKVEEEVNGEAILSYTITAGTTVLTNTVTLVAKEPVKYDPITIEESYAVEDGQEVILHGIAAASLVNRMGFYLIDDTGLIAVQTTKAIMETVYQGDEVTLKGIKNHETRVEGQPGQLTIQDAEILVNAHGNHDYNTDFFKTSTVQELRNLNVNEEHSQEVYVTEAKIKLETTPYSTNAKLEALDGSTTITLFCSSAKTQYAMLLDYADQVVTAELAPCNWNGKTFYAFCLLSLTDSSGNKIINELNFAK